MGTLGQIFSGIKDLWKRYEFIDNHLYRLQYNVRSYPTTIFYNQTVPHQYHGHHNVHAIVEFIQVRWALHVLYIFIYTNAF